jgi:hypothetical protein
MIHNPIPGYAERIYLYDKALSPEKKRYGRAVGGALAGRKSRQTVAILVTRNDKGASLVQKLKNKKVKTVELCIPVLIRADSENIIRCDVFFCRTTKRQKLAAAFQSLYEEHFEDAQ